MVTEDHSQGLDVRVVMTIDVLVGLEAIVVVTSHRV